MECFFFPSFHFRTAVSEAWWSNLLTLLCDGVRGHFRQHLISCKLEQVPREFLACSQCCWQQNQCPDCLPPSTLWTWIAVPVKHRDVDYAEQCVLGGHQLLWCTFSCLHIVEKRIGLVSQECTTVHVWRGSASSGDGGHCRNCHRKHHEYKYTIAIYQCKPLYWSEMITKGKLSLELFIERGGKLDRFFLPTYATQDKWMAMQTFNIRLP